MTTKQVAQTRMTNQQLSDKIDQQFTLLNEKISALPDKSQIYTASLAIHGFVWATIVGVVVILNSLGLFG